MRRVNDVCRLCRSPKGSWPVKGPDERTYYFCRKCYLICVDKKHLPDRQAEKERYLTHQNGIAFDGYVNFLRRAIDPALDFIARDTVGLDYGCGPAPTLSKLLGREGYTCEDFDPFFVKHDLQRKFGYIFCTEVFEHFFYPAKEIRKMRSLLLAQGVLVVMTERWKDRDAFPQWYYARDNAHVCFYHDRTFDHICEKFGFERSYDDGQRVLILKKTA